MWGSVCYMVSISWVLWEFLLVFWNPVSCARCLRDFWEEYSDLALISCFSSLMSTELFESFLLLSSKDSIVIYLRLYAYFLSLIHPPPPVICTVIFSLLFLHSDCSHTHCMWTLVPMCNSHTRRFDTRSDVTEWMFNTIAGAQEYSWLTDNKQAHFMVGVQQLINTVKRNCIVYRFLVCWVGPCWCNKHPSPLQNDFQIALGPSFYM